LAKRSRIFLNYAINHQGWASSKKQRAYGKVATKSDPTYGNVPDFLNIRIIKQKENLIINTIIIHGSCGIGGKRFLPPTF